MAAAFLIAAGLRFAVGGFGGPQARTWLLVGSIFGAVSTRLFLRK